MAVWHLEDRYGIFHQATFTRMEQKDAKNMKWTRRISWERELKSPDRQVYKLLDVETGQIQGAISMADAGDHVYVYFIESAQQNRGNPRAFVNVAKLLIAFAGQRSNSIGAEGYLVLKPKTALFDYYVHTFRAYPLPREHVGIAGIVTNHWIRVYYT